MIFHFDQQQTASSGKLLYLEDESSLFFEESNPVGVPGAQRAEITVGPVELSVDLATGTVLFASGYTPRVSWKQGQVTPPSYRRGVVRVSGMDVISGMAVRVDSRSYVVTLDEGSGWMQVTAGVETSEALLFAPGIVLGIDSARHFSGLWMKPDFIG